MLSPLHHPSVPVLSVPAPASTSSFPPSSTSSSSPTSHPSQFTISTPPTTPPSTTTPPDSPNTAPSTLPSLQRDVSHAHPAIQRLYQQLNPEQLKCVPYEALDPHEHYTKTRTNKSDKSGESDDKSDTSGEGDKSEKGDTSETALTPLIPLQFDDIFLLHHQWIAHRDARQPLYKDHAQWVHRLHRLEHPPPIEPNETSKPNQTSELSKSTRSSSIRQPPPQLLRSVRKRTRGRPSPFDDLQSESDNTISQKQRTQIEHDTAFLKDQLTHFRNDFAPRCDALDQHEQALRHAWLGVLPLLRVNGAPMTPAAIRTLEWLHQHELVPQSAVGCIDIGHRVCVEWNRNRALLCYGAIALQLMQLAPWFGSAGPVNGVMDSVINSIDGVGMQDSRERTDCAMNALSSSPFTLTAMDSPLWTCARFAIATQGIGWWSTRARWWRTIVNDSSWQYTLPTTIRSDVLLVSMGLWVVGAPVTACVGVGVALQGVSWWAVSRAVGVCNRMTDTDTTTATATATTEECHRKKNGNTGNRPTTSIVDENKTTSRSYLHYFHHFA